MKKVILGLLLFPMFSFALFDANLKYGAIGADVAELQEFLTAQGHYIGPITGNFYSLTLAGVKSFQKTNGLPDTGYFGPMSREVANQKLFEVFNVAEAQEIQELGSIQLPSNTDKVDELNRQISELKQFMASLIAKAEEQKNIQNQTNQVLSDIRANTERPVNTSPIVPITVEEPKPALDLTDFRIEQKFIDKKNIYLTVSSWDKDGRPINDVAYTFTLTDPSGKVIADEKQMRHLGQGEPKITGGLEDRQRGVYIYHKHLGFTFGENLPNEQRKIGIYTFNFKAKIGEKDIDKIFTVELKDEN